MIYQCRSDSVEETVEIGRKIAASFAKNGITEGFLSLYGEMGVGKTAFVRGFASAFGITGVKSPTYTMVNEYRGGGISLFHFDLYRIESEDDLYSIGFDDYPARGGFCLTEWSENVENALPPDRLRLSIARVEGDENARLLTLTVPEHFPCDFSDVFRK